MLLPLLAGLAGSLLAVGAVRARRWGRTTQALVDDLVERGRGAGASAAPLPAVPGPRPTLPPRLPEPVARYLALVLPAGRPPPRCVRLVQQGTFLVRPEAGRWGPFAAVEHLAADPPGFVWDARIRMGPGIVARVRDGFVGGQGRMQVALGGVLPLVDRVGTPGLAAGALHRFLAEAVWCPAALLPGRAPPPEGLSWTTLDDRSARATLGVGATRVSLDLRFGADGLVESVFAPDRVRDVSGRGVPTPWRGRFSGYERRDGVLLPLAGEVEWLLPEGPQPYWRGRITDVAFDPGA